MKNHAPILFLLALALCFTGCKTRKNTQRESTLKSEIENIATSIDKSLKTKQAGAQVRISATQTVWELTRRVEFDTLGNVRTIQETRRGTGRSQLAIRNDSARDISISDIATKNKITAKKDSTDSQKSDLKSDSRPVQGTEWIWIILSVALVLAVVIYILYNKFKPRLPHW